MTNPYLHLDMHNLKLIIYFLSKLSPEYCNRDLYFCESIDCPFRFPVNEFYRNLVEKSSISFFHISKRELKEVGSSTKENSYLSEVENDFKMMTIQPRLFMSCFHRGVCSPQTLVPHTADIILMINTSNRPFYPHFILHILR